MSSPALVIRKKQGHDFLFLVIVPRLDRDGNGDGNGDGDDDNDIKCVAAVVYRHRRQQYRAETRIRLILEKASSVKPEGAGGKSSRAVLV